MKNINHILSHLRELRRLVRSLHLTDCLNWIEQNLEIVGDLAILIISLANLTAKEV